MTVLELYKDIFYLKALTQREYARMTNQSVQNVNRKLVRETMTLKEFLSMLEFLDIEMKLTDRKTGEEVHKRNEGKYGPIRSQADGVYFNSDKADCIFDTFFADGEHEFGADGTAQEIYKNQKGQYFLVTHFKKRYKPPRVSLISDDLLQEYMEDIEERKRIKELEAGH